MFASLVLKTLQIQHVKHKYLIFLLILLICSGLSSFSSDVKGTKWYTKTGSITFFSHTQLEDIKAQTSQATVIFDAVSGEFNTKVLIQSFHFKKKLMQEHFNENYMESSKYPEAVFIGIISNIKNIDFTKDSSYKINCSGKLTMHGVTKDVTCNNGTLKINNNTEATIKAKFSVLLKDFNIEIPKLHKNNISETIEITFESNCKKFN